MNLLPKTSRQFLLQCCTFFLLPDMTLDYSSSSNTEGMYMQFYKVFHVANSIGILCPKGNTAPLTNFTLGCH